MAEDTPLPERMNYFKEISAEDQERLKRFYYEKKNIFGRDRLWFAFRQQYPESKVSYRAILDWLKKQKLWQQITPPHAKGSIRPILSSRPGAFQIDCINLGSVAYNGFKYAVNAVDIFSKRLFSMAMKAQDQSTVVRFLNQMKETPGVTLRSFTSDNGSEFQGLVQEWAKDNSVQWSFGKPGRPETQGQIERMNGTLKRILYAGIRLGDRNWPQSLQQIVSNINSTKTRTTGKTPVDVEQAEDHGPTYERLLHGKAKGQGIKVRPPLKIGDVVRLLKPSNNTNIIRRAKTGYFGEETYRILSLVKSKYANYADSYRLLDISRGEPMRGLYPASSLRLVPPGTEENQGLVPLPPDENDEYEVEGLIGKRTRRVRGRMITEYRVLYRGYAENESTWEDRKELLKTAPQAVADYDNTH